MWWIATGFAAVVVLLLHLGLSLSWAMSVVIALFAAAAFVGIELLDRSGRTSP